MIMLQTPVFLLIRNTVLTTTTSPSNFTQTTQNLYNSNNQLICSVLLPASHCAHSNDIIYDDGFGQVVGGGVHNGWLVTPSKN